MNKIQVGIVGMGYIGESHIEAVRRIGLCELAAVADTDAGLARKKAEAYGIAKCYETVEELLADPEIQAVHNCTPNHLHLEINRKIIESGKHLFSEKPLAVNYAQAAELRELGGRHPEVVAAVNFNYRMNPLVQEMRRRVERGELGDIRLASGCYLQDWLIYDTDYNWRMEPEVGGASRAIADIGSHWMDAFQHITGHRIVRVMADLETVIPIRKKPKRQTETFTSAAAGEYEERPISTEDYGAVLFRSDQGACGVFHVSEVSAGHGCYFTIELNGAKASLRWNQEENDRLWVGCRDGDNKLIIRDPNHISPEVRQYTALAKGHPEGWNDAFKNNIKSFYQFIADGRDQRRELPDFATLSQAAEIVRLTEAILESNSKKQWITIEKEGD